MQQSFPIPLSLIRLRTALIMLALTVALPGSIMAASLWADKTEEEPYISPTLVYTNSEGVTEEALTYSGNAPFTVTLKANATHTQGWTSHFEWRIMKDGDDTPFIVRYEEDTEVTFTNAGSYNIYLYATFAQGNDSIKYAEEYWAHETPLRITISESKLVMPNAFSPNGDNINDIYKAKEYQSLIEFHAYIFNRWGQKLYEWTDPADGWDGTIDGKDVKPGVYFCLVKAKGSDGREYNIRKDVNLLRGYTETTNRE